MKVLYKVFPAFLVCLFHASVASAAMSVKPVKAFAPALIPSIDLFAPHYRDVGAHDLPPTFGLPFLDLAISRKPVDLLDLPAERQHVISKSREVGAAALSDRSSEVLLTSFGKDRRVEEKARSLVEHLSRSGSISFATPRERDAVIAELSLTDKSQARLHFDQADKNPGSVVDLLVVRAHNADRARFYLETLERTKSLHFRMLPEFFRNFSVIPGEISFPDPLANENNAVSRLMDKNGGYILFAPGTPVSVTYKNERTPGPSAFVSVAGPEIQNRIRMLCACTHEYAHLLFNRVVMRGAETPAPAAITAYRPLSEGFAVTLELLANERAVAHPDKLGLSEPDANDLKTEAESRIRWLKHENNAYTEGWLQFWRPIYEKNGTAGMVEFLHRIDSKRLLGIPLGTLSYQLLLDRDTRHRLEALTIFSSRRKP